MYNRLGRRRASTGIVGSHAREELANRHTGSYQDFLRRHEMEAKAAFDTGWQQHLEFAQGLLDRAGDPRNLMLAIEHCASRGQAAGPNGLLPASLDRNGRWNLAHSLSPLIRSGTYVPRKPLKAKIPKGGNRGYRPIWIQNFEDRCVERVLLQTIRPLTEAQYLNCSFGFRHPGRSREQALATAERISHDQDRWVWICADIRNAYEQVPFSRLMQSIRSMIGQTPVGDFIERIASKRNSSRGIRQGGPLSPELLNIYLHTMLDSWWKRNFPTIPLIRVADDLLVLTNADEAEQVAEALDRRATVIGMPLKGTISDSVRDMGAGQPAEWLGYRLRYEDGSLCVSLADRPWEKLEEDLQNAWEKPIPSLTAVESIEGWISQQGAVYEREQVGEVYPRIRRCAEEQGFDEVPSREEISDLWERAYLRDWVRTRREIFVRMHPRRMRADGYADQHGDFLMSSRPRGVQHSCNAAPRRSPHRKVFLYTDGSSCRPGGCGGWGFLAIDDQSGRRWQGSDSHPHTTNNRMELTAVLQGLRSLDEPCQVQIVTDSEYVHGGITELAQEWSLNGWRSTGGSGRVRHRRLWERLIRAAEPHEISCRWVRGHSGHAENEYVDQLARNASSAARM